MWMFVLEDPVSGRRTYCSLNEGLGKVLRYGAYGPEVLERLVVHREPSTISIYDLCFVAYLPWDEQPGRVFD